MAVKKNGFDANGGVEPQTPPSAFMSLTLITFDLDLNVAGQ